MSLKPHRPARFLLTIETDSLFISPEPGGKRSRVTLSNLSADQLPNIADAVRDAGLENELLKLLRKQPAPEAG